MQKGTVKFFNESKGYGFVTSEAGKDIFVHVTGLSKGKSLSEGDKVTYEEEEGRRGVVAVNVTVTE